MKKLSSITLIMLLATLLVAAPALAGLTITNEVQSVWGNKRVKTFDIAFDSSYPYGGESLTKAEMGFSAVDQVLVLPKDGYTFVYDETNQKVKVFASAPAIVYDEQHTIASNAITLNYPAAFLLNVSQANANVAITDAGATLAASQCKPTAAFTAGVRGGLTFHTGLSGTVYVTYVTQAWKEVWDNVVQGEAVTVTDSIGTLTYDAGAIQSVRSSSGTTLFNSHKFLDKDDTVATGEVDLDWTDSAATTLTFFATDAVTAAVVTYLKLPTSGFLFDNWVEEEAMTAASNVCTPAYPVLLWGYAGQALENGADTEVLVNIGGTIGAGEATMNFASASTPITYTACTTGTGTYIRGRPGDIPFLVPLEVKNTQDLSALTGVQVIMIGR